MRVGRRFLGRAGFVVAAGLDHRTGKGRAIAGMQIKELAPRMGPAPGQGHSILVATILAQPVIGRIAVHLQDHAITIQVSGNAIAGPTVLEPIGHHWWS